MATVYFAIYPSGDSDPTDTQIITETVPDGIHGSDTSPTTTGAFAGTAIAGLAESTSYKLAVVWDDGTDTSNVVVGSAFVTGADVSVTLTGIAGTGEVGSPTVTGESSVTLTGVAGTGEVGSPTVPGEPSVTLTGVAGTGKVGQLLVWGNVPDGQTPNWIPVNDANSAGWSKIAT